MFSHLWNLGLALLWFLFSIVFVEACHCVLRMPACLCVWLGSTWSLRGESFGGVLNIDYFLKKLFWIIFLGIIFFAVPGSDQLELTSLNLWLNCLSLNVQLRRYLTAYTTKRTNEKNLQLLTNGNKFALNIAWQLLCYVLHLYPSLLKIRSNLIWMWGFCCFLEVSWHSKLRGLEMSGHLFTILCTLVSGFVFDFPNAGAQEVKLKCIDFLSKWCLQK